MKIVYIHQYFKTPSEPGGTRSYWMAKQLIKNGHEVIIITSKAMVGKNTEEKNIDGIKVVYINEYYNQKMTVFKRLKVFLKFSYKSTYEAFKQRNTDLVIATSTPLTIGIPALFLKWFKKTPYIFEVRDLWPEVPIQMGAIKNLILIWLTRLFEKIIYKNAKHVITLSPGMQQGVVKYIPIDKTSMIPNMAKKDEFWPREKDFNFMKRLGLNTKSFKLIHFGSLGTANGAFTIIESAKLLKNNDDFEFIFIGGGSTELELKDLCTKYNLKNVHFLGSFSLYKTSEIVNLCDVSIVSFLDLPILHTNSPNKLFDSLSAGKPIIVNSAGWTKDLVEKHSCGFYVNPNYPVDLVNKLSQLKDNTDMMKLMSENGRLLAETVYDKSILCNEFLKVIKKVVSDKK